MKKLKGMNIGVKVIDRLPLTKHEIVKMLKEMRVGEDYHGITVLPLRFFSFIVRNKDYNPEIFSKEVDDSEEFIDVVDLAV